MSRSNTDDVLGLLLNLSSTNQVVKSSYQVRHMRVSHDWGGLVCYESLRYASGFSYE